MAYIPDDPFGSLSAEQQAHFWEATGAEYIPAEDLRQTQYDYAVGFGFTAEEYDAMGIDPELVHEMRERYFDYMGMEWDQFDWDGWREAMGYND